ncbi:MAG: carboxypeptidase regulatory-like domain-containing protein [Pirellulales bacterium]|nr:carboxypeptidase regulatory-like domain-containing protein [Pirellulales bacterium]
MKYLALFVLPAAACLALGCGSGAPAVATVEGTITLDGQPLSDARVIFEPVNGRRSMAITDESGRYELNYLRETMGARLGKHIVRITQADGDPQREPVPVRYNRDSTLSAEVKPGKNVIDFPLKRSK